MSAPDCGILIAQTAAAGEVKGGLPASVKLSTTASPADTLPPPPAVIQPGCRRPLPPEARMIPRYTRPEMAAIWEPQTRFRIWFEIEAHAADALAELGVIPKEAAATIWAKGKDAVFDIDRIDAIEREV